MSVPEFSRLLFTKSDFLKPYAVNFTKDQEETNDLNQETLYRAWDNRAKNNIGNSIKARLFTLMRNIFINHHRFNSKHRTNFDNTPNNFLINQKKSAMSNPEESSLDIQEITKSIYELPSIFKIPFLLYFNGYKYNEISERLHEPTGTIKSRIHFARKLLKESITRN